MTQSRLRRLAVLRVSAGTLAQTHGITVTLQDGGSIGWTLCGELDVESIGRIAFECVPDPDLAITQVHGPRDMNSDSLVRVLDALSLTDSDVLQRFD